ncbi:hypothetical protein OESDEN_07879 [Oesophagostomum dentatum]|uniref:Uncharacterized protein n=1 Tax=Oesophagostomum dentatum TaxID=61180 RepID=A0A0B1T3W1_OESDE|nr:hypothetical protein OESDEN_07879 [Oesophagostomum dentatum]
MRIYDDVAVNERSPTSTLTTEMCASSPTSSIGTQCPIYENVADFAPLASRGSSSTYGRAPRLNMDFINSIPPPPLTGSDLDKSSSDYGSSRRTKRPLDMRPLSLPASERKRLEHKSHNVAIAVVGSTVICMTMFAIAVWYYYADIQKHLRSLSNSL